MKKVCIVCGKLISEYSSRQKFCGSKCAARCRQLRRRGKPVPYENCTDLPVQGKTLGEISAEARAVGKTYGQYMSMLHNKSKEARP